MPTNLAADASLIRNRPRDTAASLTKHHTGASDTSTISQHAARLAVARMPSLAQIRPPPERQTSNTRQLPMRSRTILDGAGKRAVTTLSRRSTRDLAARRAEVASDTTSIPPTSSLVKLFETKSATAADVQDREPSRPRPDPPKSTQPRPYPVSRSSEARSSNNAISSPIVIRPAQSITSQYNQLYSKKTTALNNDDQLANAIVASSLASSRGPSPHRLAVPSSTSLTRPGLSRTPSPVKRTMLHTLRRTSSSSSDESDTGSHPYGKHKKKRHLRKHPNKHHEGDRKRWRDALTERERKRYDGVWAANRDLYVSFAPTEVSGSVSAHSTGGRSTAKSLARGHDRGMSDRVSSLVVRDIWLRSRLNESILATVWDLVDGDCIGRLTQDEFVVGMWLIDQRLKGRKLPVKVSDSVWKSVRALHGIKVR